MKPLILDQPAQQALPARFFWAMLTAAGWGIWLVLWLPVLRAVTRILSVDNYSLALALQSSTALMTDFASHINIAVTLVSLFVAWALCQQLRTCHEDRVAGDRSVSTDHLARSVQLRESDLRQWQNARRMVVTHDDALGWIRGVDVSAA